MTGFKQLQIIQRCVADHCRYCQIHLLYCSRIHHQWIFYSSHTFLFSFSPAPSVLSISCFLPLFFPPDLPSLHLCLLIHIFIKIADQSKTVYHHQCVSNSLHHSGLCQTIGLLMARILTPWHVEMMFCVPCYGICFYSD
jgi:hypothetical protein